MDWGSDKCSAEKLNAPAVEQAVYKTVVHVLESPEVYLGEVERRWDIQEQTLDSLRTELAELDRQERRERETEAQTLRLASRFEVSEDTFQQEVGLVRARRLWIGEERERVQARLDDLGDGLPGPRSLEILGHRLRERLANATCENQRFVLDALGATIIAQGDGTWELELEIPQDPPSDTPGLQIVNEGRRSGWGLDLSQQPRVIAEPIGITRNQQWRGRPQGIKMTLPMVSRPSSWRWASAASARGRVRPMLSLTSPFVTQPKTSSARCSNSPRVDV